MEILPIYSETYRNLDLNLPLGLRQEMGFTVEAINEIAEKAFGEGR